MGDFFLGEELVETGHLFGEFNDIVDDEESSVPEKRVGEVEEIERALLLAVDEDHIERCGRELRELLDRVSEEERGDIVHSDRLDIPDGFFVGRKGIVDGSEFSAVFPERQAEVDGGIPVRRPDLKKVPDSSDMDHVFEEPGVLVRYIRDGIFESVLTEILEELFDVHGCGKN